MAPAAEWLLIVALVCVFAFIVLRPDRFGGKRGSDSGGDSGGYYSTDRNRSDDLTTGSDGDGGDGGGDGGGGDGGGD